MKCKKRDLLKKIMSFIIIAGVGISLVACTDVKKPEESKDNTNNIEEVENKDKEEIREKEHTIEDSLKEKLKIVSESDVPKEAMAWFESYDTMEGAYAYQHPGSTYLKINSAEQNSGGYHIHIKDYDGGYYERSVAYELRGPEKDSMITAVMTYPSVILEISTDSIGKYNVENENGEILDYSEKIIMAELITPELDSEIVSPIRIKGSIVAFEGAFSVKVSDDKNNLIHEEHLQADSGGPNWGKFDKEISFETPIDSTVGSIELGEYSAKDGEFISYSKTNIKFKK